jgi:hypothetical protein
MKMNSSESWITYQVPDCTTLSLSAALLTVVIAVWSISIIGGGPMIRYASWNIALCTVILIVIAFIPNRHFGRLWWVFKALFLSLVAMSAYSLWPLATSVASVLTKTVLLLIAFCGATAIYWRLLRSANKAADKSK